MLNGAPLSVLVALMLDRQPHTATWLEGVTGYSDKPVMAALEFLVEMSFVTHNSRYSWQLASGVQQLPFMSNQIEEPDSESEPKDSELFRVGEIPSRHDVVNINTESSKNTSSNNNGDSEKFRVEENRSTLAKIGVSEPKRSKLASLPAVNPRMIRYHAHCAAAARSARNPTGLAISLIERGSQPPEDWIDPTDEHLEDSAPEEYPPGQVEELQPAPAELLEIWREVLEDLPCNRAERLTWLKVAPAGVSTETGELVALFANTNAIDKFRNLAAAALQARLGVKLRLEVDGRKIYTSPRSGAGDATDR